jgi:hypothetical protein
MKPSALDAMVLECLDNGSLITEEEEQRVNSEWAALPRWKRFLTPLLYPIAAGFVVWNWWKLRRFRNAFPEEYSRIPWAK